MQLSKVFDKKNVVVTGGAGFIGSHLCERLVHENAHVICIDNFLNSSPLNIEHLLMNDDFVFINADINEPINLEAYRELEKFKIRFQGVQEIYQLACPTSASHFDEHKISTMRANSLGMRIILDLALKYTARTVFASSSVVYGSRTSERFQFREDDIGILDHLTPRACYDEGKRFAETVCYTFADVYRLDIKIARIFRTYGPRLKLHDGQMLNDFVLSAIKNEDLIIYGDENFSTSLTFVTDIVDGLIKLMAAKEGFGCFNLGADYEFNLVTVAEKIIEATHSSAQIRYEDPLPFMTPLGIPDLTKTKEELGWFPLITIDEGLRQTIEYTIANQGRMGIV